MYELLFWCKNKFLPLYTVFTRYFGCLLVPSRQLGLTLASLDVLGPVTSSVSLKLITFIKSYLPPSSVTCPGLAYLCLGVNILTLRGDDASPGVVVVLLGAGLAISLAPLSAIALIGVHGHVVVSSFFVLVWAVPPTCRVGRVSSCWSILSISSTRVSAQVGRSVGRLSL